MKNWEHFYLPTIGLSKVQNVNTMDYMAIKKKYTALAAVAQWTECQPANQRVACSSPSQSTCLGCGPGAVPCWGRVRGNQLMFLSLSLKTNKKEVHRFH